MQIYSVDMNLKCEISSNSSYFHIKRIQMAILLQKEIHIILNLIQKEGAYG